MTISEQSCMLSKFNIYSKSYVVKSAKHGVQSSTKGKGTFEGGRKVGFLHRHLEGVDRGHMGVEHHSWVSNTFQRGATAGSKTSRTSVLRGAHNSTVERGSISATEGGHLATARELGGFLLNSVSGPQKEWANEASYQLEVPQPVGGCSSLQNGGHCHTKRPPESQGLDGEGRSEGCILHHSNSPSTSAVPKVHGQRPLFPVHLSPVWPVMCPLDIHKGNETFDGPPEGMGSQDNYIYRRHVDPGRVQGIGNSAPGSVVVSPRGSGFHCQQGKVPPMPIPGTGISGIASRLTEPATQTAQREVESDSQGGRTAPSEDSGVSPAALTVLGEIECSIPGSPGGSPVLQSTTRGLTESPSARGSELQSDIITVQGSSGRIGLVAVSAGQLEWEDCHSDASTSSDTIGCLPDRLGCSMRRSEHRGLLEFPRATSSHQLFGASGSGAGHEDLSQVTSGNLSVTSTGQLYSRGIYQQSGGDYVTHPHLLGKDPVALGSGERHYDHSPTHTRCVQWDSRHRVQAGERQIGLDAVSGSIPENQSGPGTIGGGPLCLQVDPPTASFLQLETRSPSGSSGCIPARLERGERFCQSSVVSDRTCSQQNSITRSSGGTGGPSVEESGMVSSSSGDADGLPTTYSSTGEFITER